MARQPNIVLINCDDLGYGDLGCYGSARNDTPAIDRLAAEGLVLTDFAMASPVCSPSRAAMLTGCYPPRIGFGDFDGLPVLFPGQRYGIHEDEVTLAEALRDAGYATQIVGKWHCGDQPEFLPTNRGFDGWFGLPYSNDMGRQRDPEGFRYADLMADLGLLADGEVTPLPLLRDDEVVEQQPDQAALVSRFVGECVGFLRANRDRPFFLYLAHTYVHIPLYVPEVFQARSRNGRYGAAVAAIDWAAGVLVHELDRLGLGDDTIVVLTSDNGSRARDEGGSNDPLRGTKGTCWEGGQRVPCIVRWPGHVAPGSSSALTSSLDLFPTLLGLAGVEVPSGREIDGVDIRAVLLDGDPVGPRDELWYYRGNALEAVRSGRWKLHVSRHGGPVRELYDLVADVGETTDVAAAHPDVVAALEAVAEQARDQLGDTVTGRVGRAVRPVGAVDHPRPLVAFDPDHPYCVAEYDLADRG